MLSFDLRSFARFVNDAEFKAHTAEMFYSLADRFSDEFEKKNVSANIDVQDDYLSVQVPNGSFLLNRQTPSHQIWYSSPISGSMKFDYDADANKWFEHKAPTIELLQQFEKELQAAINN